jgi:hypothetical protein
LSLIYQSYSVYFKQLIIVKLSRLSEAGCGDKRQSHAEVVDIFSAIYINLLFIAANYTVGFFAAAFLFPA